MSSTPRRIMRTFKMHEISAVDRPAQAGARMTIMKRDFSADERDHLAATGAAMPDGSFPIETKADLENAIHAIGRAKDPAKAKAHIIARAKALGATSALPDGWVTKNHGHAKEITDMTADEIQKMIDDAVGKKTADLQKQLQTTTSQLEAITKGAVKKPKQQNADDMSEPDGDEATAKAWRPYVEKCVAAAVAKAKEEFQAELAKRDDIAKNDETIEHDGVTLRKSVIGEDQFKVMKSLTEANELNAFSKRAATEIPVLPGTEIAKAKALRAVSKLGKEDREAIEAMLKGGNAAMKAQMTVLGKDGAGDETAEGQLAKKVETYAAEHKVGKAVAYSKVLETAEGKDLYAKSLTEKRAA